MSYRKHRILATHVDKFYKAARTDPSKSAWSIANLKKVMELGFVKLEDVTKLRAACLASHGNESVFANPAGVAEDAPMSDEDGAD